MAGKRTFWSSVVGSKKFFCILIFVWIYCGIANFVVVQSLARIGEYVPFAPRLTFIVVLIFVSNVGPGRLFR
jgi:hypothetical protein